MAKENRWKKINNIKVEEVLSTYQKWNTETSVKQFQKPKQRANTERLETKK